MSRAILTSIAIALFSAPVHAQAGTAIPEPSNLALFGLGLVGLIVGRRVARRRTDDES